MPNTSFRRRYAYIQAHYLSAPYSYPSFHKSAQGGAPTGRPQLTNRSQNQALGKGGPSVGVARKPASQAVIITGLLSSPSKVNRL